MSKPSPEGFVTEPTAPPSYENINLKENTPKIIELTKDRLKQLYEELDKNKRDHEGFQKKFRENDTAHQDILREISELKIRLKRLENGDVTAVARDVLKTKPTNDLERRVYQLCCDENGCILSTVSMVDHAQ